MFDPLRPPFRRIPPVASCEVKIILPFAPRFVKFYIGFMGWGGAAKAAASLLSAAGVVNARGVDRAIDKQAFYDKIINYYIY